MDKQSALGESEFRVKESLQAFLNRHTAACVYHAFVEKKQNVEIVSLESQGHFMVIDSPEYDFMYHRLSYLVQVSRVMPLGGFIQLQWPIEDHEAPKYENARFDSHSSFGDALEHLQNKIWKRIEDE
jgi:hypothetical protein